MRFRSALAWSASGHLTQSLIRFSSAVVISRLLLPAEVGAFALAASVAVVLGALREVGTGTFLIQKKDLEPHHVQSAFGVMIAIALLATSLCLLSRSWIATAYHERGMEALLGLLALQFVFWPIAEPARALLSRDLRFDVLQKAAVLATLSGATTSIVLAALGLGPTALALGLLARSGTHAAALLVASRDHLRERPSLRDAWEIVSFGGLLSAASVSNMGATEGRKLLLGAGVGLGAVGWLDRAVSLPATFQSVVFAPLNDVLLPKYAQLVHERRDVSGPYLKVVTCGATVAWPVYFALALVATPTVVILFGESWRGAGSLLVFVLAARALFVAVPSVDQVLIAHARVRRLFAIRLVTLLVSLAAYGYAAQAGLETFGAAIVVHACVRQGLSLWGLRFIGIDSRKLARALAPALPVTGLTAAPMIVALLCVDGEPGLLPVAAGAAGSGLGWLAAVYLLRRKLPDEIEAVRRALLAQLRR